MSGGLLMKLSYLVCICVPDVKKSKFFQGAIFLKARKIITGPDWNFYRFRISFKFFFSLLCLFSNSDRHQSMLFQCMHSPNMFIFNQKLCKHFCRFPCHNIKILKEISNIILKYLPSWTFLPSKAHTLRNWSLDVFCPWSLGNETSIIK